MEYRFLGATGLKVSELCLGTWMFGTRTDESTGHRLLDRFADAGGTFVDTADVYGNDGPGGFGESERIVGGWLRRQSRDDLVIATKVYGELAPGQPVQGAGRKHILAAVEASLRRLRTDYIDLYQVHVFDDATPPEETLSTLDTLVTSGKVRFIGASNYTGWQLQKSVDLARLHGWEPFASLQPLYNLLTRDAENELIPVCLGEGLGVVTWSPLAQGWLSGRYRRGMGAPPDGTRVAAGGDWETTAVEDTWQVIDAVQDVAEETGRTPAQVSLRWLLQRPGVTAPIFGASSLTQLDDNLGAAGWSLTTDQMDQLTKASSRPLPYPYALQNLPQFRRRPR